jgi:hypothetical protein
LNILEIIDFFYKEYIAKKGKKYEPDSIQKISNAAASLCRWTKAIVRYRGIFVLTV